MYFPIWKLVAFCALVPISVWLFLKTVRIPWKLTPSLSCSKALLALCRPLSCHFSEVLPTPSLFWIFAPAGHSFVSSFLSFLCNLPSSTYVSMNLYALFKTTPMSENSTNLIYIACRLRVLKSSSTLPLFSRFSGSSGTSSIPTILYGWYSFTVPPWVQQFRFSVCPW